MNDIDLFLQKLKSEAIKYNDTESINLLNDSSFNDNINKLCNLMIKYNSNLSDTFNKANNYNNDIMIRIATALMKNYFTIYYVDINTNEYTRYSTSDYSKLLNFSEHKENFFKFTHENAKKVIYKDDVERFINNFSKEKILQEIKLKNVYIIKYRFVIDDNPTYVQLKALQLSEDDDKLIIGISNIDKETKKEIELKNDADLNTTYANIALALIRDYFLLYYVNLENDHYIEYSINYEDQSLQESSKGDKFFDDSIQNAKKVLNIEDQDYFLKVVNKEYLINELQKEKIIKLTYKQFINDKEKYVQLSIMRLSNDSSHVLFAVSNIDAQKRKEIELAHEKLIARTDILTGAMNKYSYMYEESKINELIKAHKYNEFAVVVCDINNLKYINDTYGHDAGDRYIIEAKNLLCDIFKETTIFRIGGDEFVLIIDGNNYYNKDYLIGKINKQNINNLNTNKVVVACGIAEFNPTKDKILLDVFKRADKAMYNNKKLLKNRN